MVVLEVSPDGRQIYLNWDAQWGKDLGVADAAELENVGRLHGAVQQRMGSVMVMVFD